MLKKFLIVFVIVILSSSTLTIFSQSKVAINKSLTKDPGPPYGPDDI